MQCNLCKYLKEDTNNQTLKQSHQQDLRTRFIQSLFLHIFDSLQTFSFDIGLDLCPNARSGGISGEKAVHGRLGARIAGNNLEIRTTS